MGFNAGQTATASLIGQGAGVAMQGIGTYFSAATQKENLRAQAVMAEVNARIAEMGAQSALRSGQYEVGRLTLQAGQLKGRQRAALAGSGVAMGEGSAREVQASTDVMKDIDKNALLANAVSQAWGHRMQGVNYQNEAIYARANAKGINPLMQAGTSLLGGATQVASSWFQMKQAGAWGVPQNTTPAPVEDRTTWTPISGNDPWRPISWS